MTTGLRPSVAGYLRSDVRYSTSLTHFLVVMQDITATELNELLTSGADIQLIDVRQPAEYNFAKIPGAKLIPLGEIINRMDEIDPSRDTIIHCKMGGRSAQAIFALERAGFKGRLRNLRGGITAWSNDVDPKVPKY